MKTPDFLNALPSVDDLLEDPRVRSIADRLNRSVVTTRLRGYLEQLTAEAKRRSVEAGVDQVVSSAMPASMRDLVSRVSRYLTRGDRWRVGSAINATGRLRGGPWNSGPLSELAVERLLLTASDFTTGGPHGDSSGHASDAEEALCLATGAAAAWVGTSHAATLGAALAGLADDRGERDGVIVGRGDLITLEGGVRVADLIRNAGLRVVEVGASDASTLEDYAAAADAQTAALLRIGKDETPVAPQPGPATAALAALARERGAILIEDAGGAPLLEPPGDGGPAASVTSACESVAARISAGADLVVARGDGLIGGPRCGLAVGAEAAVGRLRAATLAPALVAEPHTASALAATVEQLADPERFWFAVPVWSLITTPIENLRSRGERLAGLLNGLPGVEIAESIDCSASESPPSGVPLRLPTVAVALVLSDRSAEDLEATLRTCEPAVWTRRDAEGRVAFDLRCVFPRQDQEIYEGLGALLGASVAG